MKQVRGKLYLHESAIEDLSDQQKSVVKQAMNILNSNSKWNLIRIDSDKQVGFLNYPDFEQDPHPKLQHSFSVNLTTKQTKFRDSFQNNPPILHRKETFLTKDNEDYEKFSKLTKQEEEAGLLDPKISHKIGFQNFWDNLLDEKGFEIKKPRVLRLGVFDATSYRRSSR